MTTDLNGWNEGGAGFGEMEQKRERFRLTPSASLTGGAAARTGASGQLRVSCLFLKGAP